MKLNTRTEEIQYSKLTILFYRRCHRTREKDLESFSSSSHMFYPSLKGKPEVLKNHFRIWVSCLTDPIGRMPSCRWEGINTCHGIQQDLKILRFHLKLPLSTNFICLFKSSVILSVQKWWLQIEFLWLLWTRHFLKQHYENTACV